MNNIEKLAIEHCNFKGFSEGKLEKVCFSINQLEAFAKALQQSSELVAIKAKPIEWKQDVYDWYGSEWGFHISYDSLEKEGQEYSACWGEGDSETFATLDEAKDWCQDTADAYISSVACITHPSVPLEKYNKLLDALKEKERFIELAFQAHTNLDLDVQAIAEAEGKEG